MTDWNAFPEADDEWADFPDAEPSPRPVKPSGPLADPGAPKLSSPDYARERRRPQVRFSPPQFDNPTATDGDTLRAGDNRFRVWGIDAPELGQQGWDRQGRAVPIGQQSRDWLQGEIVNTRLPRLGDVQGLSYDRTVAPLSLDGQDAGLASVRSGNALAAPSFVRTNPDYRFKLMEAERLARLNGLGPMNDTMAQAPADYRKAPGSAPAPETIAQFWDTPTPWAGLRPEVEQRFRAMAYDPKVPLAEVVSYARENGALVDQASLKRSRDYYLEHGKAGGINYTPMPEVRQELGDGAMGAGARAYGEGFLASGLGELGAVADTLGGTDGRENIWNSDRRLADIWANNNWQNATILRGDEYAHPTATTVGNLGGAITSSFVVPYGAGARTVPQLARVGAVYGGAEGFLGTDGGFAERLSATPLNALVGAGVNAAGGKLLQVGAPALGKAVEALKGRLRRNVSPNAVAAAETAGEAGVDYADDTARGAASDAMLDSAGGRPGRIVGEPSTLSPEYDPTYGNLFKASRGELEQLSRSALPEAQVDEGQMFREAADAMLREHWDYGAASDGELVDVVRRTLLENRDPRWMDRVSGGRGDVAEQAAFYRLASAYGALRDRRFDFSRLPSDLVGNLRERGWSGADAEEVLGSRLAAVADAGKPRLSSIGMDGEQMPSISMEPRQRDYIDLTQPARTRRLMDPATDAERRVAAERVQPRDMLPLPSNAVDGPEEAAAAQAGRFGKATAPDERSVLSRGTVRGWNGSEVPKVGPTDLIGWLRLRGGLQDQGGELSHMGLTNAARRGMDHVGQEARFGPLVNPEGDTFDDAALAAWEAGYFPELLERPSINEFLDALRDTYNGGSGRRFHPDDFDELDRFEAMRGERYDLEQKRHDAGGQVWQDRSVTADDAAPFPPVEAYEDWGSNAPDFAGNIRLDKMGSPQDIARALSNTEKQVGFDAATRGRVTQAETERLASDLGMTADQLLTRRKGQALNAEEALAARQILAKSGNELVNFARKVAALDEPGDEMMARFREAWMRHVAIQEQVSGMTAEAGRALQQFRMLADSREVRSDVLSSIITGGGGNKRLKEAAETLLDAVESGPGVFNTVAEKAAQPKWRDKIAEWYVNALLGWPQTHVVNVTSNTLTSLAQIPEYATGALIGGVRQAVYREAVDRVTASEVGARAFGLLQGAKEGARLFAQALRTGEGSDFGSKVEAQQFKAIDGKLGEVVRIPTRFLTAEDELFKGIARRMELNGQAVRIARKEGLRGEEATRRIAELVADPTDEMFQRALDYGRYLTFQQKLGPFAQKVSALASENLPLKFLLPFVRTPTNLLKFATERSPAAPLLKEWRADFMAKGERRDMAVAKMLVGTGFGLAMYEAAAAGIITGSAPSDPKKARLLYADGWKPYSVKLDGTYYSYKRLDPFATTIGVAADFATLPGGMTDKQREDKSTLLIASIMGNLASKTWLSGAASFIEAIGEPERYAGDFKNRLIASFLIPNVVGGTARSLDPIARKPETLEEEMQSRIPGVKDDLLPRRDVWGRPIKSEGGLGPDAFSPIWISEALNDPVNHELMQLDYAPGVPSKKIGSRELTPAEHDRYVALAGKGSHKALSALVASPEWRAMDDAAKVKAARKAVSDARRDARGKLFGAAKQDDPWEAFEDEPKGNGRDQWASFPDAPSRDVVADLTAAIPGIRFTSGYRSPEYNQSLKARGYNPAEDSEHLDGSALDMLPPPNRSLEWLLAAVKKHDPKARLLVHDGHLHGAFNGYYGAPVLGGALAFGDKNPNARRR